ncbi:MAG: hypothetical protein A2937_02160 [Candidatus Yonathbacteria bacterium RIFCSPLOWO2_01_FULL_47_33b]|uniref:Uncharacterized protein n=1 Tax=Candidatus Yonathbacteria bacterium RIFCSPLOWO2_01_FULL_47_33b TaxID=1802727 RepID=A0A1G2SHU0_9BACT|nr:MAG: hypothetical protein A2937_02160 [Candidatus Yonathbacteria bacterium RIFCSPLOWO2_01_FULL_47_33b]
MKKHTIIIIIALVLIIAGAGWWNVKYRPTPQEAITGHVVKNGKVYYDVVMQVQWDDNKIHQQIHEFEVVGADAKTFTSVSVERGVNAEADTDPQTFAGLSGRYGKDKARIFSEGNEILPASSSTPAIDVSTLKIISELFVRDAQHVYLVDSVPVNRIGYMEVPVLDPNTFMVLNRQYAKDAQAVYYIPFDGAVYSVVKMSGLDPKTFHIVGFCGGAEMYREYYVADARTVLAKDTPIAGADSATFRIVGLVDKNPDGMSITGSYSIDKNRVYKDCGEVVSGVSPAQCIAGNLKGCERK